MPPKPKFSRQQVIDAALQLVSEQGIDALTSRDLGVRLGSSARPVFTVFRSMEEVQQEVQKAAMQRFEQFARDQFADLPLFKQFGMKMVLFGIQEPNLYRLLFMQQRQGAASFEEMFGWLGSTAQQSLAVVQQDYGLSHDQARQLFENMWIYTFGVGTLCATRVCSFSQQELSRLLSTQFHAMMLLVQAEGEKAERC